MGKKIRYEKNAPLEPNDKVIAIHMDDEFSPIPGGMPGVVKSVANVFGMPQYYVNWRNGSGLALIDGEKCQKCGNEQRSGLAKCQNCGDINLKPIDQWRKVVEEDDEEELNEGFLFFTTKRALTKQMIK